MLVVFHVPPATDDPIGALALERRQGMASAGPVRIGEPSYEGDGEPTVTFLLDLVSVLMELARQTVAGTAARLLRGIAANS